MTDDRTRLSEMDPWWSLRKLKAADLCADFINLKTWKEIAAECRVDVSSLFAWRKHPLFIAEVDRLITIRRRAIRPEAFRALVANLRKGEMASVNTALKVTGDYIDRAEMNDVSGMDRLAAMTDEELEAELARLRELKNRDVEQGGG